MARSEGGEAGRAKREMAGSTTCDNANASREAFLSVATVAIASGRLKGFFAPEFDSHQVKVARIGTCQYSVRFIAPSPMDFAKRVTAVARYGTENGEWSIADLSVSGRLDPFSRP